jgi:hypothetical protein
MTRNAISAAEAIQRAREAILRAAGQLTGLSSLAVDRPGDLAAWAREMSTRAVQLADETRRLSEAIEAVEDAPSHIASDGQ